jgi:hypothetical protein
MNAATDGNAPIREPIGRLISQASKGLNAWFKRNSQGNLISLREASFCLRNIKKRLDYPQRKV